MVEPGGRLVVVLPMPGGEGDAMAWVSLQHITPATGQAKRPAGKEKLEANCEVGFAELSGLWRVTVKILPYEAR